MRIFIGHVSAPLHLEFIGHVLLSEAAFFSKADEIAAKYFGCDHFEIVHRHLFERYEVNNLINPVQICAQAFLSIQN